MYKKQKRELFFVNVRKARDISVLKDIENREGEHCRWRRELKQPQFLGSYRTGVHIYVVHSVKVNEILMGFAIIIADRSGLPGGIQKS